MFGRGIRGDDRGRLCGEKPNSRKEIDVIYQLNMEERSIRPVHVKDKRSTKTKQEDFFKLSRARLVLMWMFTNATLDVLITSACGDADEGQRQG